MTGVNVLLGAERDNATTQAEHVWGFEAKLAEVGNRWEDEFQNDVNCDKQT